MTFDAVIIGSGLAGMVAALRLAESGQKVAVLAKGAGSLHLSGGTIDVLGYAPDLVQKPAAEFDAFVAANPDHPYALVPLEVVDESIEWLKGRVPALGYAGSTEQNFLLPTAVGTARPTAVVPETMIAGDLRAGGRFALAGFGALKDFFPVLAAGNLERARPPSASAVEARAVDLDPSTGGERNLSPVAFARLFDRPDYAATVATLLQPRLADDEIVGVPAVLGIENAARVHRELEDRLGHRVFEIPTLPPSVPGIRLFNELRRCFAGLGGRLLVGAEVVGAETENSRVTGVRVRDAARERVYKAASFVLATGGWTSGGLELDSHWQARETVFDLPVWGVPEPGEPRFYAGYFDEHPIARAGVAVDAELHPLDEKERTVYENLYAAGSLIAGAQPWREKSGDGLSLATGYGAAAAILEGKG